MTTDPLQIAGIPQLEEWSRNIGKQVMPAGFRDKYGPEESGKSDGFGHGKLSAEEMAAKKRGEVAKAIRWNADQQEEKVVILPGAGITVAQSGNQYTVSCLPPPSPLKGMSNFVEVPIGGIIMYSGTDDSIQMPWHICDGQGGTPDLRDKFIVAAYSYDGAWKSKVEDPVGTALLSSGGAKTHTHSGHTIESHVHNIEHKHHVEDHGHEIPDHAHHIESELSLPSGTETAEIASTPLSTGSADGGGGSVTGGTDIYTDSLLSNADPYGAITESGGGGGASLSHDSPVHIPPYYVLALIMRIQ